MQDIRDAILADDTAALAGLSVPESYRGITVHADEADMFEGMASREKDPRKSLHLDEVPTPEVAPGEALVAVMASAINYNTVWTSIFEPVSTFGFLKRYGRISELAKRHDLPYHVVGSDLSGVVLKVGAGVQMWKPGDKVVAHCLSVELESPAGPRRHDDGPGAAHLGLRDELRRPGRHGPGQDQPADAEAGAPHLGGGRVPRPRQLHRVPPAGQPPRRQHDPGRRRPDLGRVGRPRLLRHAVRPQRRRDAGVRRLLAPRRPSSAARWAPS